MSGRRETYNTCTHLSRPGSPASYHSAQTPGCSAVGCYRQTLMDCMKASWVVQWLPSLKKMHFLVFKKKKTQIHPTHSGWCKPNRQTDCLISTNASGVECWCNATSEKFKEAYRNTMETHHSHPDSEVFHHTLNVCRCSAKSHTQTLLFSDSHLQVYEGEQLWLQIFARNKLDNSSTHLVLRLAWILLFALR